MSHRMRLATAVSLSLGLLAEGVPSAQSSAGAVDPPLRLSEVQNGFGLLLPHRVPVPDANGDPSGQIVEIRSYADLGNLRPNNPILPSPSWPLMAVLPSGAPGNHFLVAHFDQPLDIDSVLSDAAARAPFGGGTGALRVERVDPASGARRVLRGRGFVGGRTYGSPDPNDPSRLLLETWVVDAGGGNLSAVDPRGLGFPGTESGFAGAELLVDPGTFVFVPDADGTLATHEAFPLGCQIQLRLTRKVRGRSGAALAQQGLASASVGVDTCAPELALGRGGAARIVPRDGQVDVDPRTDVLLQFSEPIQLLTLGALEGFQAPRLSAAFSLSFGPEGGRVSVPFSLRPLSVFDLTTLRLDPAYDLPGSGPQADPCPDLAQIEARLVAGALEDLQGNPGGRAHTSTFRTASGPGLVNAPVAPDTIYIARSGPFTGLSVLDLNGFGAATGDPTYDFFDPIVEGNSNYPNNPNVRLQGSLLIPPLGVASCSHAGGASGAFRLTRDSNLGNVLIGAPSVRSIADMALGHALDNSFNNSAPGGCAAGGGNVCANTGLKFIALIPGGPNTLAPRDASSGQLPIKVLFGHENLVSFAPHPNPPPLVFPPLCQVPLVLGQEPTSVDSTLPPLGLQNLLVPGPLPLGNPDLGIPPRSLLSLEQNAFFQGPSPPRPLISECSPYSVRQQIGQFLYVADREAGQVVVLNSNRFTVLDRVPVPDPTSLAMSPNLDFLAITSESTDQVFFLDVDPLSSRFHEVVRVTAVGDGPRGIAWESGNEDILVCCTADSTLYVISAFNLNVRKVLSAHLQRPLDIALTPRQAGFGFARNVYFGYVLNENGSVALFESGPDGVNGWGFDDVVGRLPFHFFRPKAIQPDVTQLASGFFVVHELPLGPDGEPTGQGGGALTRVAITGGTVGILPLQPGEQPHIRNLEFGVQVSVGEGPDGLSGIPVDVAFDDQRNLSALTNRWTPFSAGQPLSVNGKSLVKDVQGAPIAASAPQFVFLAIPDSGNRPGAVDVLWLLQPDLPRVDTDVFHPGFQSIPAPGVTGLMHYFRQ